MSATIAAMRPHAIGKLPTCNPNASRIAPDVRTMMPPRHVY